MIGRPGTYYDAFMRDQLAATRERLQRRHEQSRETVEAALQGKQPLELPPKTVVVPLSPGGDYIAVRYERQGWTVIRVDPSNCS